MTGTLIEDVRVLLWLLASPWLPSIVIGNASNRCFFSYFFQVIYMILYMIKENKTRNITN